MIRPKPPSAQLSQDEDDWLFFTRIEVEFMHLITTGPRNAWLPAAGSSSSYVPLTAKALCDANQGVRGACSRVIRSNSSYGDSWSNAETIHDSSERREDCTFKVISGAIRLETGLKISDDGKIPFVNPPRAHHRLYYACSLKERWIRIASASPENSLIPLVTIEQERRRYSKRVVGGRCDD